jgi:carboxylesterase
VKEAETGVIFVHGIQGSPRQFDFLAEKLPKDILYRAVLLPGHGATLAEFKASGAEEWLSAVLRESEEMKARCERLVYVGHSMGCLLGLMAEREKKLFSEMLFLCCPFYARLTLRYLRNGFCVMSRARTNNAFAESFKRANSVPARGIIAGLSCVHPYMELLKIMRLVKNENIRPGCPARFFFSSRDEIVSPKSARYAAARLGIAPETLAGCGHNYFTDEARSALVDALLEAVGEKA